LSPAEQRFIKDVERWRNTELGYALEQANKPQTLAYALNDSPAGLAAWIVEKFRTWSDCAGDIEKRFTKDEVLSNLTIYWATETINSSIRLYYENSHDQAANWRCPRGWPCLPEICSPNHASGPVAFTMLCIGQNYRGVVTS
jgi:hypothetical protein